jgi:hypothetical protein
MPAPHRSATEQIEYWAEMGRQVSMLLNPDDLLSVSAGLARIKVEPVHGEPVDPDEVFQSLEAERASGTLPHSVTCISVRYQASIIHPGYLEQIDADGNIKTGRFRNGVFIELTKAVS